MISVSNITVSFSGTDLFKGISFVINPKDRIGLVGKNGVGKSTLMKIIAGQQNCDAGTVDLVDGATIGYLPQEVKSGSTKSIYDETLTVFEEVLKLEAEIESINKQLEERTDYESEEYTELITRLPELHERLNIMDSGKMESNVEKVLKGLGFKDKDLQRPVAEFSGGWQMRVELAKLLLLQPSLMLLDEPTNHLDIESILWLEEFFNNYPGAIMMVSHDRMFLDNITNRTIEIAFGKTYDYKVSYSKFFDLREERFQQQEAAYRNQQRYIAQQERFIERFKAKATKARQAQSKMKQLDKLERIEFDDLDQQAIRFRFPPAPRSGDVVVRARDVSKSYGDLDVLKKLDFEIERGDRVAFVGKNGEGKSTLVKLITGEENHNGELTIGHNVDLGYYAQVQEKTLDKELSVYDSIDQIATDEWRNIARIRSLLGAFLFKEDDIDKKVKVLSGGEKSRLALAKLLLRPVNLLILDEPTNHLDLSAKEVLKQALMHYNGTMILVSHDRDFLQGLTTKTFEFKNQKVREHLGEISLFLEKHQVETFRAFESTPSEKNKPKPQPVKAPEPVKEKNQLSYQERKERDSQIRKAKKAVQRWEKKVDELEKALKALEEKMQAPGFYESEESKDVFFQHSEMKRELDQCMEQWEKAVEEVDAFENS